MIQLITLDTFHDLNCFGHMIYALQTSSYQNIDSYLIEFSSKTKNGKQIQQLQCYIGNFYIVSYH